MATVYLAEDLKHTMAMHNNRRHYFREFFRIASASGSEIVFPALCSGLSSPRLDAVYMWPISMRRD